MKEKSSITALTDFEKTCMDFLEIQYADDGDAAHDISHIRRVVANAKKILETEKADREVVIAAAWLHDCVVLAKDHSERKKTSLLAAEKAGNFLAETEFHIQKIQPVKHAIEAHSFSAGITPETTEAKIVQDADRLDALGAIGIARCLMVGGKLNRPLYHPDEPLPENREIDDRVWTIDHFYAKLFELPGLMHTPAAKKEAERRIVFMKQYLGQLKKEI